MPRTPEQIRKIRASAAWRGPKGIRLWQLFHYPMCKICESKDRITEAKEVDHIVPLENDGEPFDPKNLQSMCFRCHVIKTAQENRERSKLKNNENSGTNTRYPRK